MVRYEDWTMSKKVADVKRNFERPSESLKNNCSRSFLKTFQFKERRGIYVFGDFV